MNLPKNILLFAFIAFLLCLNFTHAEEETTSSSQIVPRFSEPIPSLLSETIEKLVSGELVPHAENDCDEFIKTACSYVQKLIQQASQPAEYDTMEAFLKQARRRLLEAQYNKEDPKLSEHRKSLVEKVTNLHTLVAAWQSWQAFRSSIGESEATKRFLLPLTQTQNFQRSDSSNSVPNGVNWKLPLPRSIALRPLMEKNQSTVSEMTGSHEAHREPNFSLEPQNHTENLIKKAITKQDYTTLLAHYYSRMKNNWFYNFSTVEPHFLWATALRMDDGGQYDFAAELYILVLASEKKIDPAVASATEKRLNQLRVDYPENFKQGRFWAAQTLNSPKSTAFY